MTRPDKNSNDKNSKDKNSTDLGVITPTEPTLKKSLATLSVDEALFAPDHLSGMVATYHVNERPLQGVVGLLDWRFQGAISNFLKSGALTGQEGECAYLPIRRGERLFHILLLGSGSSKKPGARTRPSSRVLKVLRENLENLKIRELGLSLSDFGGESGNETIAELKELTKNISLRVIA